MSMPPPPPAGFESLDNLGGAQTPHPRGTLVLVLGILSFFICGIVLGGVAFVMGSNALREIDRNPSAYTNRRLVSAGRICGAIGAALSVALLIFALTSS
ncbi:MAG: DUF4190 domain-containing protein [Ilumatobacter sp.]|nr:DUF4190 domain-containing protein [Ilumatobacter sp.]NKB40919.1 DUF4190 domain-containing protein [Ilumatobacter sp.]